MAIIYYYRQVHKVLYPLNHCTRVQDYCKMESSITVNMEFGIITNNLRTYLNIKVYIGIRLYHAYNLINYKT